MCGFDGVQRDNYFREQIMKTEIEVRVRNLRMEILQVMIRSLEDVI